MAPDTLPAYAAELRRRRLPWLHGYPSLLALLAAFIVDADFDLGYEVTWVTTGAENVLPHQAALIRSAFGVAPRQHYGQTEGVAQISECELGSLHVDEDFSLVEFVPTAESGCYRLVGTNLINPVTPLLRYDTGDVVRIREEEMCGCGRHGRVVHDIDGRREDYVILRNHARIGRMDHIFKDMINVREAQIYQRVPGEITLRIVRGSDFDEGDERALVRETTKRVGAETKIEIEYWESLPRSTLGKLRFVVSEIDDASISDAPSTSR
jgi:phenylacetate-CoA ligase